MASLPNLKKMISLLLLASMASLCQCDGWNSPVRTFDGVVGGGNYSYYTVTHEGSFTVVLRSLSGDADLYISDSSVEKPTFDLDGHYTSSASCGIDKVDITRKMQRPVGIGVYGHPRYDVSEYRLEFHMLTEDDDPFKDPIEDKPNDSQDDFLKAQRRQERKAAEPFESWGRSILEIITAILEVILEILL